MDGIPLVIAKDDESKLSQDDAVDDIMNKIIDIMKKIERAKDMLMILQRRNIKIPDAAMLTISQSMEQIQQLMISADDSEIIHREIEKQVNELAVKVAGHCVNAAKLVEEKVEKEVEEEVEEKLEEIVKEKENLKISDGTIKETNISQDNTREDKVVKDKSMPLGEKEMNGKENNQINNSVLISASMENNTVENKSTSKKEEKEKSEIQQNIDDKSIPVVVVEEKKEEKKKSLLDRVIEEIEKDEEAGIDRKCKPVILKNIFILIFALSFILLSTIYFFLSKEMLRWHDSIQEIKVIEEETNLFNNRENLFTGSCMP